jgi:riboflavin synthase
VFTGIIQAVGRVSSLQHKSGDLLIGLDAGGLELSGCQLGDSIAVNGVCLTVIKLTSSGFLADVSNETLSHTTIASCKVGDAVNLEKALTLSTPLGGHLVSGHVDGIGNVASIRKDARSVRVEIGYPAKLARYIAEKGSITLDGVSLTVNSVSDHVFGLNIVPHTAEKTIISRYRVGQSVHLEIDMLARYVERMLNVQKNEVNETTLTKQKLAAAGFMRPR